MSVRIGVVSLRPPLSRVAVTIRLSFALLR
jgi:hypothetical protein